MKKGFYVFAVATAALFVFGAIIASMYFNAMWPIPVFIIVGIIMLVLVPSYHKDIFSERVKTEVKELLHNLKEEEKCMIQSAAVYTNRTHNHNIICETITETLDKE